LREEFEAHGIELSKVNPKLVGFQQALQNLKPILYDSEKQVVDMGKAYRLFGLRGAQAAAILTKAFVTGDFSKMLEYTYEVGSASRMAAKQMEGLGVKIKNLADRAKLIAVAFGEGGAIGVMKGFIDALRAVTKAVADFVSSGPGRLATSFTVWTGTIWLSIQALKGLSALVLLLSTRFKVLITSLRLVWVQMMAIQAASGASILSFKGLKGAITAVITTLKGLSGAWLIVAAAIAAVVAAIKFWLGAQQRAVDQAIKLQQKQEQVVKTLEVYAGALEDLKRKQEEQKDITKEHAGLVARLSEEYKALSYTLSKSAEDVGKNVVLTQRAYNLELKKSIITTSNLAKEQEKLLQQTIKNRGRWEELKTFVKLMGEVVFDMFSLVVKGIRFVAEWLAKGLGLLDKFLRKVHPLLGFFTDLGKKGLEGVVKFFDTFGERVEKTGRQSEEAKKQMEALTQTYVAMAKKFKETGEVEGIDNIIKRIEAMQGIELRPEQIAAIKEELNKVTVEFEKSVEEWEKQLGKLPESFKEMFSKLDPIQKVEFAKRLKQMENEIAATTDQLKILLGKEEGFQKEKAAIRAKYLAKFAEDMGKETATVEENLENQIDIIQEAVEKENQAYEDRLDEREKTYETELKLAEGNEEELNRVKQENLEKRTVLEKDHQDTILGYQSVITQKRAELEAELTEKILKENAKTTQGIIKELKKRQSELKKEAEKFEDTSLDFRKKRKDEAVEIARQGMNEEQKFRSIMAQRDDVLRRARAQKDEKLFDKALDLTKKLATEVKNENGDVIYTLEENAKRFSQQYQDIARNAELTFKNLSEDRKKEQKDVEAAITRMSELLKAYKNEVDEVSKKKLELQADEAMNKLEDMYDWVTKFRQEWDQIESKTVTLNVVQTGGGGGGGTVEARVDKDLENYFSDIDAMKKGGIVRGKIKEVKEVIHRRVGGWADKAAGKIRGYGGGDIVKAVLEPGEYVARKEAVRKYGPDFFEGLNKMTVPQTVVEVQGGVKGSGGSQATSASAAGDGGDGGGVAAKIGGLIKEIKKKVITSNKKVIKLRKGGNVVNYVRSAGARVHSSLSNISYTTNSRMAYVAAQAGGLISAVPSPPVVVKMQEGGTAMRTSKESGNYYINISPKFMSGDRHSARVIANEIKKEIDNINQRRGR
jgi:hypothetical protein